MIMPSAEVGRIHVQQPLQRATMTMRTGCGKPQEKIYNLVLARYDNFAKIISNGLERDKGFRETLHRMLLKLALVVSCVSILRLSFTSDGVIVVKGKKNGHKNSVTSIRPFCTTWSSCATPSTTPPTFWLL